MSRTVGQKKRRAKERYIEKMYSARNNKVFNDIIKYASTNDLSSLSALVREEGKTVLSPKYYEKDKSPLYIAIISSHISLEIFHFIYCNTCTDEKQRLCEKALESTEINTNEQLFRKQKIRCFIKYSKIRMIVN